MKQPLFMPGGRTRLAVIATFIFGIWVVVQIAKYWIWAGLFGITVPGWNS